MTGGAGYFVHVAESVEAYVGNVDTLPDDKRQQVLVESFQELSERANHFLERYPLEHESYTFQYDYVLLHDGVFYQFRFVVDGSSMEMGVIKVIYVDCETSQLSP
jgi:hypothetical protein